MHSTSKCFPLWINIDLKEIPATPTKCSQREDQANPEVWPICGRNSQHITDIGWERMATDVKTLEIPWWLQLSKRQYLRFCRTYHSGEVGGSNPLAPTKILSKS